MLWIVMRHNNKVMIVEGIYDLDLQYEYMDQYE